MRNAIAVALRTFALDLASWSEVLMRESWARDTAAGLDVLGQLNGLADLALSDAKELLVSTGPLEEYTLRKAADFAATADIIADRCPEGTLADTLRTMVVNFRAALSDAVNR
jgi:hypothetical protein